MKVGILTITIAILLPFGASAGPAPDLDSDGIPNVADACEDNAANANTWPPDQYGPCLLDSDNDGFGNACDGDLNNDGATNATDGTAYLNFVNAGNGTCANPGMVPSDPGCECIDNPAACDFNCDGTTNATDGGIYLGLPIGPNGQSLNANAPGPSGLNP